jgi:16S rRNA (guanine527-N7)-methyltransferase
LAAYLGVLAAWSPRVNLTAAGSEAARVGLLIAPALPLARLLLPGALLDVGSGNGSPGLVLAALDPGRPVGLLEPRTRRWAFLREAARAMGLGSVEVLRVRHDGYVGPPAPNVTLRGLRLSPAALAPLLAAGGRLFVLGGSPPRAPGFAGRVHGAPGAVIHEVWRA